MKKITVDTINIMDLQENMYDTLLSVDSERLLSAFCNFFGTGRILTRDFADFLITEGIATPGDLGVDEEDYLDGDDWRDYDDTDPDLGTESADRRDDR